MLICFLTIHVHNNHPNTIQGFRGPSLPDWPSQWRNHMQCPFFKKIKFLYVILAPPLATATSKFRTKLLFAVISMILWRKVGFFFRSRRTFSGCNQPVYPKSLVVSERRRIHSATEKKPFRREIAYITAKNGVTVAVPTRKPCV